MQLSESDHAYLKACANDLVATVSGPLGTINWANLFAILMKIFAVVWPIIVPFLTPSPAPVVTPPAPNPPVISQG